MDTSDRDSLDLPVPTGALARTTRRALLRLLNTGIWAEGVGRWTCPGEVDLVPVDAVIAIPARDECARIASCLDACARSAVASGLRVRIVVLVNGTRDDTVERVLAWSRHRCPSLLLVDVDLMPALAHAGGARRLALDVAGLGVSPETALLTTDADARPLPSWVAANVERLRGAAHLVCGQVTLDPAEAARLPACVETVGELEGRYRRAVLELEHLIDPDPDNPWPHHGQASGASLAIRAGDLAAVGGVPPVPCGEDRALARRVRACGLTVVHASEVGIEISCRMHGRAAGGMADALRTRLHDADPICDEALEPAATLYARLVSRARLRAAWPRVAERENVLAALGTDSSFARRLARIDGFETARDRFERAVHDPCRVRLRASELRRELPFLLAFLELARGGRPGPDGTSPDGASPEGSVAGSSVHRRFAPAGASIEEGLA